MAAKQPYPEEFKVEAVKQITEQGHRVADVSAQIGMKPVTAAQAAQELMAKLRPCSCPTKAGSQLAATKRAQPEGR